ncbi:50S ribosomal protein L18 [Candidatus Methylomirabilis lanthanidiphila]|uniref:Large ribosomal subunit protein uL18 n=1 Tax=Candidatus Methylomirabilis lanthanidiphila TaxID=2211376 RepID=A0A564ZHM2_9BACT|nr:50S ribosomal protein L18 [Candidatus Methylomirabilis lanthanidiphila]VUZ84417.1 50S ribosomal protein L18 [Candidatus Methylomirabilis lanthanidiphila]
MAGYGGKQERRQRRHRRIRKRVVGSAACPRLSVFRSAQHIYAQIVDDEQGKTLAAASTLSKEIREQGKMESKTAAARAVGELLAGKALAAHISRVVFDRGGFKFHGRVKALAVGLGEKGIKI